MVPTEDALEQWVLEILQELGWTPVHGPEIAPGELGAERADYREVILTGRLRSAVARLNPNLPPDAVADVVRTAQRTESPLIETENWNAYRYLIQGVPVEYRDDWSIGRSPRTTTLRRSTSSASKGRRGRDVPTSCCSSTACHWPSSS